MIRQKILSFLSKFIGLKWKLCFIYLKINTFKTQYISTFLSVIINNLMIEAYLTLMHLNCSLASYCTTRSVYPVLLHVRTSLMFFELHDMATRRSRRVATPFCFARDTARLRQMDNRPRCRQTRW